MARGRRRRTGSIGQSAPTHREIEREARVQATRVARRRIVVALISAIVLVTGAVVFTAWLNREPEASPPDVAAPPDAGAAVILGLSDEGGALVSIALVSAHSVEGSRVILFPPSLATVLPGFGERDLSDAASFDGADLLSLTVTNLLGVRIDAAGVASAGDFAALFEDSLSLELTQPLVVEEGGGETVVFGEGTADRTASELQLLLEDQGTSDQLAWLVRQSAVWESAFTAAGADGVLLDDLLAVFGVQSEVGFQALSTAAVEDPLLMSVIPAARVSGVGTSAERYTVSSEDGASFVEEFLPYLQLAEEPRVRVEVLNGNGRVGTTAPIARALIRAGFRVVFTDNADRQDYGATQLIAQGAEHQQAAVAAQRLLGSGEVFLEQRQPSGVVDLTIIVGSDLATEG